MPNLFEAITFLKHYDHLLFSEVQVKAISYQNQFPSELARIFRENMQVK